jgi:tricarballylate dehydrogenase
VPDNVTGSEYSSPMYDLVVVGCGAAGMAVALSHLQHAPGSRVLVLERTDKPHRGGNTTWTGSFFRLEADGTPSSDFVDRMRELSWGESDESQIAALADNAQSTIQWLTDAGVEFESRLTYFLTAKGPRLMPAGGGVAMIDRMAAMVERLGGEIRYSTTALDLTTTLGRVDGVVVGTGDERYTLSAGAVVLACGGFEGSTEMLVEHLGEFAEYLPTIAPGGRSNQGEGIRMALAVGAGRAGQYDRFHGEPVDPRSRQAEALIMGYPHGILVNGDGVRFVDEASDTPDNTFEDVAFQIWHDQQQTSHLIGDQKLLDLPGLARCMLTDHGPITADTIDTLAQRLSLEPEILKRTIDEYNAAVQPGEFDPSVLDGKGTVGLVPSKSNWARTIDEPPYVAWPVSCAITFTFGGIRADASGRVLTEQGDSIPGLYAVGEVVGLYYHRYPGATSVLRALTFGRLIGMTTAGVDSDAVNTST